eukprot:591898-Rhodomonas_salina.1
MRCPVLTHHPRAVRYQHNLQWYAHTRARAQYCQSAHTLCLQRYTHAHTSGTERARTRCARRAQSEMEKLKGQLAQPERGAEEEELREKMASGEKRMKALSAQLEQLSAAKARADQHVLALRQ